MAPDQDPDRTPIVSDQPPPEAMLRILNPIVRALIATPFARVLPSWMAVLEFTGRHSGKRYRVPVGVHDVDGVATVFSERPWRVNFRDGASLTVGQRGRQRHAHGVLVDDHDAVGTAFLHALQQTSRPSNLGIKVAKGHEPTAEDLARLGRSMIQLHYDEP